MTRLSRRPASAPRAMRKPSSRVSVLRHHTVRDQAARRSANPPKIESSVTATSCRDVELFERDLRVRITGEFACHCSSNMGVERIPPCTNI
jgi:hypothetical protein